MTKPKAGAKRKSTATWLSDPERLAEVQRRQAAREGDRGERIGRGWAKAIALYDAIRGEDLEPAEKIVASNKPDNDTIVFLAFIGKMLEDHIKKVEQRLAGANAARKRWKDKETDRKRILAAHARTIRELEGKDRALFEPRPGQSQGARRASLKSTFSKMKKEPKLP